jgi:hypothetical protein
LAAILLPLALLMAGPRPSTRDLTLPLATGVFLAAWYGAVTTLAGAGGLQSGPGRVPTIFLALLMPLALGFGAVWLVEPVRRALASPDLQPLLIAMQAYRIAGAGFLVLVALGQLPAIFGLPAGLGDLLVGLGAFGAAAAVRRGRFGRAVWWNALGLFDLALALTLGVGSGPSPLHFIPATPSSGLLSTGAFALVPSFIVPLDIWLHVVSLRFLLAQRRQPRPSPSPVPASAA